MASETTARTVSQAPSDLRVHLLMALLCAIWGSTWLVVAKGLQDLPPFSSAATRFAIAWATLSLLAPRLAAREGGVHPGWRLALVMGSLNFGASYSIVYWSETVLPSGLVSLLWAIFPMLMAIGGHLTLPGERLVRRQWWGFLLGLVGVALLFLTDLKVLGPEAIPAGMILLLSPLASTVGTIAVKRAGSGVSSVLLTRDSLLVGALVLAALALGFERGQAFAWSPRAIAGILYLSLVGTVVTFTLFFWLMRYAPAYKLSLVAYVTPAVALGLGAWLNNELVTAATGLGALGILAGVALVVTGKRNAPADESPPAPLLEGSSRTS